MAVRPKIGNLLFLIFYQMKQAMPTRISMIALAINCFWLYPFAQGSVSATYTAADIPTSYNAFSPTCNGSNIQLQVALPAGESYPVTGINIAYSMTALGAGQMAHQRSQVKCVNTGITETTVYEGAGTATGTFAYARQGVTIANGEFAGGTLLLFEIHAWRTVEGTAGCNTSVNRVNAGTWTITVFYGNQNMVPRVGINNNAPAAALDVAGKIKLTDDFTLPQPGMVRWNAASGDFEGYNGKEWLSLTRADNGWGENAIPTESQSVALTNALLNDHLGQSVSISGNYAIAGAPNKKAGANVNQGQAFIYTRAGNGWTLQATLTDPAGAPEDNFGSSVSMSGDYVIVGAPNKDVAAKTNQGAALIFYRNGSEWTYQATIVAGDGANGDGFGNSVSISGSYAVIGAKFKDVEGKINQGQAYIYNRTGTAWSEQMVLTASDGAANDYFGEVVSISGHYALAGAPRKTVNGKTWAGQVYVFYKMPGLPGQPVFWMLQATLAAEDAASGDFFGNQAAISGNYLVIGAPDKDVAGINKAGQAYIFGRTGLQWQQQAVLLASDGNTEDYFGSRVAIYGDYALVAANNKNVGTNQNQGKAYVFYHSGSSWQQQTVLIASDGMPNDYFGNVSISGTDILIGVPFKEIGTETDAGKIYFFKRN